MWSIDVVCRSRTGCAYGGGGRAYVRPGSMATAPTNELDSTADGQRRAAGLGSAKLR